VSENPSKEPSFLLSRQEKQRTEGEQSTGRLLGQKKREGKLKGWSLSQRNTKKDNIRRLGQKKILGEGREPFTKRPGERGNSTSSEVTDVANSSENSIAFTQRHQGVKNLGEKTGAALNPSQDRCRRSSPRHEGKKGEWVSALRRSPS